MKEMDQPSTCTRLIPLQNLISCNFDVFLHGLQLSAVVLDRVIRVAGLWSDGRKGPWMRLEPEAFRASELQKGFGSIMIHPRLL